MAKFESVLAQLHQHGRTIVVTACVAVLAVMAIYFTQSMTAARIERNEHLWLDAQINALIPTASHDNDLLADRTTLSAPESLGTDSPATIYRARRLGLPVAVVINSAAPDGYGGPIELLVAINYEGDVLGVRILEHHETPHIGDAFEQPGSHWLSDFKGRSAHNPDTAGWNVRKDGGEFEQFTSATITPRAIIKAVQRTLDFYTRHRDEIFAAS
jgi:electron transport complex protein RnfG